MARTVIGTSDALTIKKYSASLTREVYAKSFWAQRFMADVGGVNDDPQVPIWVYTDLEAAEGDQIRFDLVKSLNAPPTAGDNLLMENAERLIFFTDAVNIDQLRHAVDTGGRMTKKRTLHDLRDLARNRLSDYFAALFDEMIFYYLAGGRGVNTTGMILPTSWSGHAGNSLQNPDSGHWVFPGTVTSESTMTASDVMTLTVLDKALMVAKTAFPQLQPLNVGGEDIYVCIMHPRQARDLRANTNTGQWLDIQKALVTKVGEDSPIFRGGLGMYNGILLYEHPRIPLFNMGAGGSVPGARALFLGKQALAMAFGTRGEGLRFSWNEELVDLGNILVVGAGTIMGMKKVRFNNADFGVITVSTAAAA